MFAHKLLNNLHFAEQLKALHEIIRVLEVGGEARIELTATNVYDMEFTKREPYFREIKNFLEENFGANGRSIKFSFGRYQILKIEKIRSVLPLGPFKTKFQSQVLYPFLPSGSLSVRISELPDWILELYINSYPEDRISIDQELQRRRHLSPDR